MIIGMLRIRNEARWIERSIGSILPLCERVVVLDDHSTDGTPELCAALPKVTVYESHFEGIDESRDKQWLLEHLGATRGDWILHIDGDEELMAEDVRVVRGLCGAEVCAWRFKILYL